MLLSASKVRLLSESVWIIFGQVATVLGGMALVKVTTNYLGPDKFGELALYLMIAAFVTQIVMGGIGSSIGRHYSLSSKNNDHELFKRSIQSVVMKISFGVIVLGIVLLIGMAAYGYMEYVYIIALLLMLSLADGYYDFSKQILTAARKRRVVSLYQAAKPIFSLLFIYLFVSFAGEDAISIVMAYLFSVALIGYSQFYEARKQLDSRNEDVLQSNADRNSGYYADSMVRYALPISFWGVFAWLQQSSGRFSLGMFGELKDVGYYSVVMQIGYSPMIIVSSFIIVFITPIMNDKLGLLDVKSAKYDVKNTISHLAFFVMVVVVITAILVDIYSTDIILLISNKDFIEASEFLSITVVSGGLYGLAQLYSSNIMSLMKTRTLTVYVAPCMLVGAELAWGGGYYYGLIGVVYSQLIYSISMVIVTRYVFIRINSATDM